MFVVESPEQLVAEVAVVVVAVVEIRQELTMKVRVRKR